MGRRSKAVKLVGGVRGGRALLDDDERRRAIEAGERDIDDGVGFLRYGSARHGVDGRVRRRVQGPFQGRDRPRPGDERHAGTGNPRRAPRRDTRHRQTGEGRGRRARPRGTRVRDGAPNPPHRPRAAGHRNGPKPGITRTKRRKPPHYKSGTKNRPYQCARRHVRTTPRSVMRPGGQRLPAYSSWSIAPENTRFTAGRTTFSDGVRQEFS